MFAVSASQDRSRRYTCNGDAAKYSDIKPALEAVFGRSPPSTVIFEVPLQFASMALSLLQVPSFPSYTGPHKVGTSEFEIPVSSLESPAPSPESDIPLSTILFRVFYPADNVDPASKPVYWIPDPQVAFTGGLAEFLGAPKRLSNILGYDKKLILLYHLLGLICLYSNLSNMTDYSQIQSNGRRCPHIGMRP